jgi:hypothetical protein
MGPLAPVQGRQGGTAAELQKKKSATQLERGKQSGRRMRSIIRQEGHINWQFSSWMGSLDLIPPSL